MALSTNKIRTEGKPDAKTSRMKPTGTLCPIISKTTVGMKRKNNKNFPLFKRIYPGKKGVGPPLTQVSLDFQTKLRIKACAVNTLKNIVKGYTVAYPTEGMSFPAVALEYAKAGGSVILPAISPINVK